MASVHPDTLSALTSGIQSEVASYVFYREASHKKEAGEIKVILEGLALEEKQHFHVLERQYDSLVRSEKWISTTDILKQDGLPEISEEMSQTHQRLIDEVSQAGSLKVILDIAFRLEKEAHDLFSSAVDKVDSEEGKKIFKKLAAFEEGHMRKIAGLQKKYS